MGLSAPMPYGSVHPMPGVTSRLQHFLQPLCKKKYRSMGGSPGGMTANPDDTRRRFLHWFGTAALLGLAGCGTGGEEEGESPDEGEGGGEEETVGGGGEETATGTVGEDIDSQQDALAQPPK
jgi:hypothetical protein